MINKIGRLFAICIFIAGCISGKGSKRIEYKLIPIYFQSKQITDSIKLNDNLINLFEINENTTCGDKYFDCISSEMEFIHFNRNEQKEKKIVLKFSDNTYWFGHPSRKKREIDISNKLKDFSVPKGVLPSDSNDSSIDNHTIQELKIHHEHIFIFSPNKNSDSTICGLRVYYDVDQLKSQIEKEICEKEKEKMEVYILLLPELERGFEVYNNTANGDLDGDGISDHLDRCPTKSGPPENNGCPKQIKDRELNPISGQSSDAGNVVKDNCSNIACNKIFVNHSAVGLNWSSGISSECIDYFVKITASQGNLKNNLEVFNGVVSNTRMDFPTGLKSTKSSRIDVTVEARSKKDDKVVLCFGKCVFGTTFNGNYSPTCPSNH